MSWGSGIQHILIIEFDNLHAHLSQVTGLARGIEQNGLLIIIQAPSPILQTPIESASGYQQRFALWILFPNVGKLIVKGRDLFFDGIRCRLIFHGTKIGTINNICKSGPLFVGLFIVF